MNKKTIVIIILVAVVLLGCVAAALWYIPKSTEICLSLDAVKMDGTGKEIGTAKIEIQGTYLDYFFQEDHYDLAIAPFDDLTDISLSRGITTPTPRGNDNLSLVFTYRSASINEVNGCTLLFSKDLEYFCIYSLWGEESFYYVASASGDYTIQEIATVFYGMIPGL